MYITDEQLSFILGVLLLVGIAIIVFRIIQAIFRLIKRTWKSLRNSIKRKRKKVKGYKNYKGDTWYPDGTIWNAEKEKWEEADYKNNK